MDEAIEQEMEMIADLSALLNMFDRTWYIASKTNISCIIVTSRGVIEADTLSSALHAALALYGAA